MTNTLRCVASLVLASAASAALAEFPDRPITLVVPFAAGGPTDKIARDLAEALRKPLGQTIVVDNAIGAGGTIGSAKVARATPDGYTLLVHHIGMATAPALYRKLSYKVPDDFETLGLINEAPSVVIGKPSLTANSFAELRQWIAANGSKVNIANAGLGSASHLCGLMFQNALKTTMTTVPYKGTAPAMTDLIGGQVDLMCEQAVNAVPQIEGKKVKTYGVTSLQRLPLPVLKDTPTLSEVGLKDFNVQVWHGLYAPKGTPAPVLARLNSALRAALNDPELIKREEALGLTVVTDDRLDPASHRKFVEAEKNRWAKVIKDAGEYAD
ncbi:tripartite tricarboxylate transporter substrate-binding protein [Variovorax arabinosiphilus]|uniref:tripartite tricarboxylate transporter substrate-binding protein n=1 Tax=Variovorax arabinosiphilus TaxID=3053498 RepID=UPI002576F178|nr:MULTISPECIES: tripartite tricarboxylate transporter substrate-binding protein [unclassified Variovorax]MDM0119745.1 tripartite tricarboxylate transporter substrate-binding protein [Variovorax sp. J2L1-78]MDM0128343.1 tripartite tricarboxylate transporter substrate-binding protein [Variovorax sp. J2L1-63]MDM0232043.1 tripartite tricarboxylate transporter substrate-binding protein [Variovorax sp. J2R1-6]